MPTSSKFIVPTNKFVVSEETNKDGLWAATVAYRIKDGRAWRDIVTVKLREKSRGTIELDTGSRAAGGRSRTGTYDRQEAVDHAVKQVEKMGESALRDKEIERTIHAGEDKITMMGGYSVWLDRKLEERQRDPANGVTDATLAHVRQACEIAVNMKGRDFRLVELVGQMDQFVSDLMAYRRSGFVFDPELVDQLELNSTGKRNPSHPNTAAKDARRVCEVIKLVAGTVDPENPERMLLQPNPVAINGFEWPREDNRGQGKAPISWATQALLLSPLKREDSIEPAPLDQVDDDGATRLVAAIMGHHGVRRHTPLKLQRKHIATNPEEVRAMISEYGRYLRTKDLPEYEGRFWILHVDTKMSHLDRAHYTRPVPCNKILEAEIRRYFDRHELWDVHPGAYLFANADSNRSRPFATSTFYKSNSYKTLKNEAGDEVLNRDNRPIPVLGEDGLPVITRPGGRFERAMAILRSHLHEQGEDWTAHVPVKIGDGVHGYRSNLEEGVVAKGWIQVADVEGLHEEFKKMNLARYADYLLNRKMHVSDRNERYAMLEPILLFGIVDHEPALKVTARLAEQVEEEESGAMQAMERAAGLVE